MCVLQNSYRSAKEGMAKNRQMQIRNRFIQISELGLVHCLYSKKIGIEQDLRQQVIWKKKLHYSNVLFVLNEIFQYVS